jgi:PAS domain-containing protein
MALAGDRKVRPTDNDSLFLSLRSDQRSHEPVMLKTHPIELEMQNEELVQTQQLLAEQNGKCIDLYDFAPVAFFVLDRYNIIADCNLRAAQMVGTQDLASSRSHFGSWSCQRTKTLFRI